MIGKMPGHYRVLENLVRMEKSQEWAWLDLFGLGVASLRTEISDCFHLDIR